MDREEVVGQKVVGVFQSTKSRAIDKWLDTSSAYLKLENGRVIRFVSSDCTEIVDEKIPLITRIFSRKTRPHIKGQRITEIYRILFEGKPDSAEPIVIGLDGGTYISETGMAPKGTGAVGIDEWTEEGFQKHIAPAIEPFWKPHSEWPNNSDGATTHNRT